MDPAARRVELTLPEDASPDRLDRSLAALMPALSRSRLKALILDGRVTAEGVVLTDPSVRVKAGQKFAIFLPEPEAARPVAQPIALAIVFEDDDLVVVDKPAGMVVHPAPGNMERTLVNALLAHCGDGLTGIGGVLRPGIVHRLDKDTSGLLVAAKTATAHASLAAQFAAHTVERRYRALAWGVPRPAEGRIEGAIGRSTADRKRMAVVAGRGKAAVTHYRVVRRFGDRASLVECRLETGRTHQVRVHLAHIGHALIGDRSYGERARRRRAGDLPEPIKAFSRQALHAAVLGFDDPRTGLPRRFESDLPGDLRDLIACLETL